MTEHPARVPTDTLPALRAEYEVLDAMVEELMWRLDVISDRIAVEELLGDVRDMVEGG
jgi:hypothetical protein